LIVDIYSWIKAFHIISVISWMAGMLYLPRLFVYHCAAEPGSVQSETFKVMERRLLRAIINPAMIATWLLGLWLAWHGPDAHFGWFASGWLQAKIVLVLALSAVHGLLARWVKAFAADRNRHSQRFFRVVNEVPTVLMIAIVILVVIKPF
jgi:putative membrane protein